MGLDLVPHWYNIGEKPTIILYTEVTPLKYALLLLGVEVLEIKQNNFVELFCFVPAEL